MNPDSRHAAPEAESFRWNPQEGLFNEQKTRLARRFAKDPRGPAEFTIAMLWAWIALTVVALISDAVQISELARVPADEELLQAAETRQKLITLAQIILFFPTGFAFLRWTYIASRNAHEFGTKGLETTPGWAVGWYFVPLLNLWRPFQAMKEIWQASQDPAHWQDQPGSPLLGWWWFFWISTGFIANLINGSSLRATNPTDLITSLQFAIVGDAILIILSLLAIAIVKQITRAQVAWATGDGAPDESPPGTAAA